MKKRVMIWGALALTGLCVACKRRGDFASVKEGALTVNAIRTKKDGVIKVRLGFDKYDDGLNVEAFNKVMQYNMDSCFYLQHRGHKNYPLYITPIANGIDKTFEYLIGFEEGSANADTLVYVDRHGSQKNIELIF